MPEEREEQLGARLPAFAPAHRTVSPGHQGGECGRWSGLRVGAWIDANWGILSSGGSLISLFIPVGPRCCGRGRGCACPPVRVLFVQKSVKVTPTRGEGVGARGAVVESPQLRLQ